MGVTQLSTNAMHSTPLLPLHVSHLPNFWNVASGVRQLQPRTNILPITLPYQLVTSHPMSQGWLLQPETLEPWYAIFVPPTPTKPTNMPPTDSKSVTPDPREINIHAFEDLQKLCKEIQQICEAKHPTNRKDDETQNPDGLSEQSTLSHASHSTPIEVARSESSQSDRSSSLTDPETPPSNPSSTPSEGRDHLKAPNPPSTPSEDGNHLGSSDDGVLVAFKAPDPPSTPSESEGENHLGGSNDGKVTARLPTPRGRLISTRRRQESTEQVPELTNKARACCHPHHNRLQAPWYKNMCATDSLLWVVPDDPCCSPASSEPAPTPVPADQDPPPLLKQKNQHNSEACACCTQALDLDEAAAAIKASDPSSIPSDPSSIPSEGRDHLGASDGGVIAVAGIVALFTLTGAYRVFNQSRKLIPRLNQKITQASHPMRIKQLKRSLNNAYVNLGATIVNVATMGGMLAGLAVAAATPIGWGLLIGYAGIQAIRHLSLVIRTHRDMAHHSQAHEIAKTDYTARKRAYLGISASFACQGIGAILIIAGLASGGHH